MPQVYYNNVLVADTFHHDGNRIINGISTATFKIPNVHLDGDTTNRDLWKSRIDGEMIEIWESMNMLFSGQVKKIDGDRPLTIHCECEIAKFTWYQIASGNSNFKLFEGSVGTTPTDTNLECVDPEGADPAWSNGLFNDKYLILSDNTLGSSDLRLGLDLTILTAGTSYDFTGETIEGDTSGATGICLGMDARTPYETWIVYPLSGTFLVGEEIIYVPQQITITAVDYETIVPYEVYLEPNNDGVDDMSTHSGDFSVIGRTSNSVYHETNFLFSNDYDYRILKMYTNLELYEIAKTGTIEKITISMQGHIKTHTGIGSGLNGENLSVSVVLSDDDSDTNYKIKTFQCPFGASGDPQTTSITLEEVDVQVGYTGDYRYTNQVGSFFEDMYIGITFKGKNVGILSYVEFFWDSLDITVHYDTKTFEVLNIPITDTVATDTLVSATNFFDVGVNENDSVYIGETMEKAFANIYTSSTAVPDVPNMLIFSSIDKGIASEYFAISAYKMLVSLIDLNNFEYFLDDHDLKIGKESDIDLDGGTLTGFSPVKSIETQNNKYGVIEVWWSGKSEGPNPAQFYIPSSTNPKAKKKVRKDILTYGEALETAEEFAEKYGDFRESVPLHFDSFQNLKVGYLYDFETNGESFTNQICRRFAFTEIDGIWKIDGYFGGGHTPPEESIGMTIGRLEKRMMDAQVLEMTSGFLPVNYWSEIRGKPTSFPPSGHYASHINGGSDEIISALNPLASPYNAVRIANDESTGYLVAPTISMVGDTFTITAPFSYYQYGIKYTITGDETISLAGFSTFDDIYIYFDETRTLVASTTPWNFGSGYVFTGLVYKQAADYRVLKEQHLMMGHYSHEHWHTFGPILKSGCDVVFTDANFQMTEARYEDEDILHILPAANPKSCHVVYSSDTGNVDWIVDPATTLWNKQSAGAVQYDNDGTLTNVGTNNYVSMWMYLSPDNDGLPYFLVGQEVSNKVVEARTHNPGDLVRPGFFVEFVLAWQIIVNGNGTYEEIIDWREPGRGSSGNPNVKSHTSLSDRFIPGAHNDENIALDYTQFSNYLNDVSLVDVEDALIKTDSYIDQMILTTSSPSFVALTTSGISSFAGILMTNDLNMNGYDITDSTRLFVNVDEQLKAISSISGDSSTHYCLVDDDFGEPFGIPQLNAYGKIYTSYVPAFRWGNYIDMWDASTTNYPDATPEIADYYICEVGGTVSGIVYSPGDVIIWDGLEWDKFDTYSAYMDVYDFNATNINAYKTVSQKIEARGKHWFEVPYVLNMGLDDDWITNGAPTDWESSGLSSLDVAGIDDVGDWTRVFHSEVENTSITFTLEPVKPSTIVSTNVSHTDVGLYAVDDSDSTAYMSVRISGWISGQDELLIGITLYGNGNITFTDFGELTKSNEVGTRVGNVAGTDQWNYASVRFNDGHCYCYIENEVVYEFDYSETVSFTSDNQGPYIVGFCTAVINHDFAVAGLASSILYEEYVPFSSREQNNLGSLVIDNVEITQILESTDSFVDSDSMIMTAKLIDDRINTNINTSIATHTADDNAHHEVIENLADLGITATAAELNYTTDVTSLIQAQLDELLERAKEAAFIGDTNKVWWPMQLAGSSADGSGIRGYWTGIMNANTTNVYWHFLLNVAPSKVFNGVTYYLHADQMDIRIYQANTTNYVTEIRAYGVDISDSSPSVTSLYSNTTDYKSAGSTIITFTTEYDGSTPFQQLSSGYSGYFSTAGGLRVGFPLIRMWYEEAP